MIEPPDEVILALAVEADLVYDKAGEFPSPYREETDTKEFVLAFARLLFKEIR